VPDLGLPTAMTVLSAIRDVTSFPSAKKLVGHSGLDAVKDEPFAIPSVIGCTTA